MSEWKEYILSDLMEIKYGKDHKHLADGLNPLYGSGGIMRYVEKSIYEDESILIPRKGTLSNLFYVNQPFWSVDTMFWSKINKELALPKFLYYHLKTHNLADLNVGSAVPSLTTEILNKVRINIPKKETQIAISEILSSLDDKIELNNKINQELESLAQLLFKHWFVDFEFPNENGEPYKSTGGEMVVSELGEIPKEWEIRDLESVSKLSAGGDKPLVVSEEENGTCKVPIFSNGITNYGLYGYTNVARIFEESVTVSARGTIGFVCLRTQPYFPIVRLISIIPTDIRISSKYLYMWLRNSNISGTGTTQQQLTVPDFKSFKILVPDVSINKSYTSTLNNLFDTMQVNNDESKKLSKLRDILIPLLISGELQINEN